MRFLYQLTIQIVSFLLPVTGFFSPKMKKFISGRKQSFPLLNQKITPTTPNIWIHVASLGEYEQGLPIMEAFKKEYPTYKIVLTFFSPSGYEVRKNNTIADVTLYLPLDTKSNVCQFLNAIQPKMVFFIKYEFWPNYLNELKKRHIPTFLVSGIFRKNQLFFKFYGGFYRKALKAFEHFFVQNQSSKQLLHAIGLDNVTVHGDTRFDRVAEIVEQAQPLEFIEQFKNKHPIVVVGSSWVDDEEIYLPYLNSSENVQFIIAPHNIKEEEIQKLIRKIKKKTVRYSQYKPEELKDAEILIIDTIGLLTQIYAYADIAYVGGAFRTGLHNILEPATYGIPVVIGPKYTKFQEANDLVALGSCLVVHTAEELAKTLDHLFQNTSMRLELGTLNKNFVLANKNATQIVMKYVAASI